MADPSPRPAPRFGRLGEYGWGRRAALILAALAGSVAFAYAADIASRHALWQVVRVCALDKATIGSPFPCLEAAPGYVVLRPPVGKPDTILSPTRAIVGLEDPRLQEPDEPNYFALAWAERRWLPGAPAEARVGLAVNSRLARSQDHLHVHLGCVTPDFAARLDRSLGPKTGEWFRAGDMGPGLELWTYRTGTLDAARIAPFRLLRELVGDASAMRRTTLALAIAKGEFVVAALRSRPGGWYAAAEDVIDPRC
jgi:CDP-diacylglycerol pyrophosphatase